MQGSSLTIVLVIAISVLINLILTLIIRRKDKSQKTIKNINNQIQTFRSDVTTLSERIRALGQETLQNVDAKASVVRDMLEKVEDELSSLSEHSQDLSALQSVCISYKNALDKLRIATDQAEARIRAVQEEVEKAESVNDFIRAFQSDAEALTGMSIPALFLLRKKACGRLLKARRTRIRICFRSSRYPLRTSRADSLSSRRPNVKPLRHVTRRTH